MLQLIAIKSKDKVYISDDIKGTNYGTTDLIRYLFNNEKPTISFNSKWVEVSSIPIIIEKVIPETRKTIGYKLKEGFAPSEKLKETLDNSEDLYDEDSDLYELRSLYEPMYEVIEGQIKKIDFELNVISEVDGEFKYINQSYSPVYNFLDTLNTHPVLLQSKPCILDSAQSYKIIRKHIQENINPKLAKFSSDCDFCLKVIKLIPLSEPEKYTAYYPFAKKKNQHKIQYRSNREVVVYSAAPKLRNKVYEGYPECISFRGENAEDLENNIQTYLSELMDIINAPVVDCPHCKGRGVI